MTKALSGQQMTLPVSVGVYSCSSFGHSAWLTPVVACEKKAPCDARRTRIRACDTHSLTSEPTHSRRTVEALWPALHPIHEVDAVLAGGRATPTTNSCAGNRDKAPRRKCSQFPELISSAAVAGTCRLHAIYMNQQCIYVGKVGETVKYGWARHPRRGTVGPTPRMQT